MGIQHHFPGLARIRHHKHLAAIGQAKVSDLDGLAHTANPDRLLTPVELAHLAWLENQGDIGLFARGATVRVLPPLHETLNAVLGAAWSVLHAV